MENRYKFPKLAQIQYFQHIEAISALNTNQLAELFNVVPRTYRDWRQGKYTIPEYTTSIVEKQFHIAPPINTDIALRRWTRLKQTISTKGGHALFNKHGSPATVEGRILGGIRTLSMLRQKGRIPLEKPFHEPKDHSIELAEFVGILLGDGHIDHSQWSITLNSVKDAEYANFVQRLVQKLFLFNPTTRRRTNKKAIVVYGGGKRSINYFLKIGLHIGNKVKQQVGVPTWIERNRNYRVACLRGLMDTDGGIFLHTYHVNAKTYKYIKLCFANRSIPLINFVYHTLFMLQLQPKLRMETDTKRVWIYNEKNVEKYVQIVKPSNPRLLQYAGG